MSQIGDRQTRNINNVIAIVKLASLILCAIVFCAKYFRKSDVFHYTDTNYELFKSLAILAFIILMMSLIWSFFTIFMSKPKHTKVIQVIEILFFMFIYSCFIYSSNTYNSNLKFLFIFLIITTTIQAGEKFGISVAVLSSIIILTADLIYSPKLEMNVYFQDDLILIGVFILIAWTLTYYVKFERKNLAEKEIQLEVLDKELKNHNKQREYMEELITKSETCYSLLIENANGAILVHRDNGIIFCNESAAKLLGAKESNDLIGTSISKLSLYAEKESFEEQMHHLYYDKQSTAVFEQRIEKRDGSVITVLNTSAFCMYEGKATVLSILQDITSQKKVEKLQMDVQKSMELLEETREYNKFITEFFANISHELKTPLNVIFSAVQLLNMLNEEVSYEKQGKYLKIMKQNCYRLMRLINNLLDLTRADSGFLKLNLGNYDIVLIVEDIVLSVVPFAESRGISIIFDTEREEQIFAFDPDKIERIILNLLSNAIKFTNMGGQILVNIQYVKDYIFISVKDTGIGIPEDKQATIFDRFVQVDKTFRRNHEGSGIGLSLVKSFVEMHGGKIEINSKVGYGSEFVVKIPKKVLEEVVSEEDITYESNIERINIEFSDIYSEAM